MMRLVAKLLSARALLQAQKGEIDVALRDCSIAMHMARHSNPWTIGALVAYAVHLISACAVRRSLHYRDASENAHGPFLSEVSPKAAKRALYQAMLEKTR